MGQRRRPNTPRPPPDGHTSLSPRVLEPWSNMSDRPGPSRIHLTSLTDVLNQRVKVLFPGFESNSTSCTRGGVTTVRTEQLFRTLTEDYHRNKHVEHTIVKSAWYCKQERSVGHEFIILQVEDTLLPNGMLTNYVVLDRCKGVPQRPRFFSKLVPRFLRVAAMDIFRVSNDGNLVRLVEGCDLAPYKYLEQITFESNKPLRLYELATLASHVSDLHPKYNVTDTNSYWFAGLIWECMIKMRTSAKYINATPNKRGRIRWIRYTQNPIQVKRVCKQVREHISKVRKNLPTQEADSRIVGVD
ncbi:hypothetical protein CTheo_7197 [Ceratobasidium theobromae]|uniref:Uncharacterized protein n=1 Tax=Ceratobasidium theobromae TaxID=1582974 RepID=A0A5N5QCM3_9AGAM|nr:hypothetical protein CTheo_7197 [Ceratobasidium theobromae]